jgi:hypothetical protein
MGGGAASPGEGTCAELSARFSNGSRVFRRLPARRFLNGNLVFQLGSPYDFCVVRMNWTVLIQLI